MAKKENTKAVVDVMCHERNTIQVSLIWVFLVGGIHHNDWSMCLPDQKAYQSMFIEHLGVAGIGMS